MSAQRYIVATVRSWNIDVFRRRLAHLPGQWVLVERPDQLATALSNSNPRFVFFPHWNWKIPTEIYSAYRCVGFHTGDLPRDRGGSPVQNLIAAGRSETSVSAFKVSEEVDSGPVYEKRPISLLGNGEEIFIRLAETVADMIEHIVATEPAATPQGPEESKPFLRRTPEQSRIPAGIDLVQLFDHIRMLDADGYPRAFIEIPGYRIEFRNPVLRVGSIEAIITIRKSEND
jgi:methionyl-tRNA formyltransferase